MNAASPNAAPPPPPSPPRPPHARPPLRRDRSRKVLGGVAAGVARTLGIDVIIVRIVFVIAAFVWIGIPAYIVAWIALPWDDGTRDFDGNGDQRDVGMIVALGLIGLGALIFVQRVMPGGWHAGGRFIGPLLLIAGGVTVLVLRRPGARIETQPEPEPPGPPVFEAPPVEPADAGTEDATDEWYGDPLPDLPASAWTQTAPWATIKQERREQRRARRAQRHRPFITPVTLSILLIGAGVTLFIGASGIADVNLAVVFAIGTIIVGAALLASAWIGRAYGLIAVGVVLAVLTAATATIDVPLSGGTGRTVERPQTITDLQPRYQHGIGEFVLDLGAVAAANVHQRVKVEVGLGHLEVKVPRNSVITVHAHNGAGAITVFDAERRGWDITFASKVAMFDQAGAPIATGNPPPNATYLDLDLRLGAGNLEVTT